MEGFVLGLGKHNIKQACEFKADFPIAFSVKFTKYKKFAAVGYSKCKVIFWDFVNQTQFAV